MMKSYNFSSTKGGEMNTNPKTLCIRCDRELEVLYSDGSVDETSAINDGTAFKVVGGYGSRFDEDAFIATICDDCIQEKLV